MARPPGRRDLVFSPGQPAGDAGSPGFVLVQEGQADAETAVRLEETHMPEKLEAASPTSNVEYDEAALRDAEKKMHTASPGPGDGPDPDPTGGHDPEALDEAAERMGTKPGS